MGRAPRTVPKSSPYRIAWSSAPAPDCRSTDEVAPLDVLPKTFPAVVATSAAVVKVSTRRKRAASRLSGPPSTSASYVARNRTGILLRDIGLAQTRVGEPRKMRGGRGCEQLDRGLIGSRASEPPQTATNRL